MVFGSSIIKKKVTQSSTLSSSKFSDKYKTFIDPQIVASTITFEAYNIYIYINDSTRVGAQHDYGVSMGEDAECDKCSEMCNKNPTLF